MGCVPSQSAHHQIRQVRRPICLGDGHTIGEHGGIFSTGHSWSFRLLRIHCFRQLSSLGRQVLLLPTAGPSKVGLPWNLTRLHRMLHLSVWTPARTWPIIPVSAVSKSNPSFQCLFLAVSGSWQVLPSSQPRIKASSPAPIVEQVQ